MFDRDRSWGINSSSKRYRRSLSISMGYSPE
jgi:hypothetical protein